MRKPVLLIFTNACILIAIFALLSQSLFAVQRVAQVNKVQGTVKVQRGGKGNFEPITEGMQVKLGDVMQTGPGSSAEFSWLDGTRWKLFNDSEAVIKKASFNTGNQHQVSQLHLNQGQVLVRVAKELPEDSRFEVETPTALVSTKGQVFKVGIASGFTSVDVFRGQADVKPLPEGAETFASPEKRAVETPQGWTLLPTTNASVFKSEPGFVQPHLEARAKVLDPDHVLINAQTEPDCQVLIDGQKYRASHTGLLIRRLKIEPGTTSWRIESVDPYGQRSALVASTKVEVAQTCMPVRP